MAAGGRNCPRGKRRSILRAGSGGILRLSQRKLSPWESGPLGITAKKSGQGSPELQYLSGERNALHADGGFRRADALGHAAGQRACFFKGAGILDKESAVQPAGVSPAGPSPFGRESGQYPPPAPGSGKVGGCERIAADRLQQRMELGGAEREGGAVPKPQGAVFRAGAQAAGPGLHRSRVGPVLRMRRISGLPVGRAAKRVSPQDPAGGQRGPAERCFGHRISSGTYDSAERTAFLTEAAIPNGRRGHRGFFRAPSAA